MRAGAFLRRRAGRVLNAALNLLPGPITRIIDQARSRRRHEELAERVEAIIAELEAERAAAKDEREQREIEELFARFGRFSRFSDGRLPRDRDG